MGNVIVTTQIAAPVERVWQALTVPAEVSAWDGVTPIDVAADYPVVGQHARWRSSLGSVGLTLHDRITVVEPPVRFAATIDVGFVHVDEEYRLAALDAVTELVTDDAVSSRVPGLGWLAVRLTRANVVGSMSRLRDHCERA
jgi:uncharacterized protein YndB with AHSA1/START domain